MDNYYRLTDSDGKLLSSALLNKAANLSPRVYPYPGYILSILKTPDKKNRNKGHAGTLLSHILLVADAEDLYLYLAVDQLDGGGLPNRVLRSFYRRYGFRSVTRLHRSINFMERKPFRDSEYVLRRHGSCGLCSRPVSSAGLHSGAAGTSEGGSHNAGAGSVSGTS